MTSNKSKINNESNTKIVIKKLKELIDDKMIFESFIQNIRVVSLSNNKIYIIFPTKNDAKFISRSYSNFVDQVIKDVFDSNEYIMSFEEEFSNLIEENDNKNIKVDVKESNLNKRYQLSNYFEAKFNKKIISLGKKVINQEKTFFNPIFIHSSSGLGKTHFINAIGNELVKKGRSVGYINPDTFIKKVTQFLRHSNQDMLSEIIDYYKDFDVLLFDDIQQYGSKPATLNVLFNILNYHIEKENQIIIAADKNPNLLGGFEERFITRFQGGITEEISTPSLDDLMIIFKAKLKQNDLDPNDWENEAIKFIVRNHSSSIRTLEGAINKIEWNRQNELQHVKYTYQTVTQMFSSIAKETTNVTPDTIVDIVAKYYGISKNDILGKSRNKEIILARHISMWLIRNVLNKTYKEIGQYFKGKDHSTVLAAVEKIDYQIKINQTVKDALKVIRSKINE